MLGRTNLFVEGLGVGGGGRDVGVTGSLVGAGGELELVGGLEVGVAGGAVGGGVILEVEEKGEHGRCQIFLPQAFYGEDESANSPELAKILGILEVPQRRQNTEEDACKRASKRNLKENREAQLPAPFADFSGGGQLFGRGFNEWSQAFCE